jgi:hypothetical protein
MLPPYSRLKRGELRTKWVIQGLVEGQARKTGQSEPWKMEGRWRSDWSNTSKEQVSALFRATREEDRVKRREKTASL